MKRIEGSWVIQYSIIGKDDSKIISPTSRFSSIKNGEIKNYVFGIENKNNIDDYSKYFAFGNFLRLTRQDKSKTRFIFNVDKLNNDSLVLNQQNRDRLIIHKKIPKNLNNNIDLKKLIDKSFELKIGSSTDTIYIDNSYLMFKKPNETFEKWNSDGWKLIKVNGFDILLTGSSSTFIVNENNGKIYLNQFGLGTEIMRFELNEIVIDTKRVKQIVEEIKKINDY